MIPYHFNNGCICSENVMKEKNTKNWPFTLFSGCLITHVNYHNWCWRCWLWR